MPVGCAEEAAGAAHPPVAADATLVEARQVTKRFGALVALDRVDFDLRAGEVHCVLGENGAGKTTLMNTIYGLHVPDEGTILVHGRPVAIDSPRRALDLRVGMVHQQFMLIPPLSVLENVVLGTLGPAQAPRTGDHAERVRSLAGDYGFALDVDLPVAALSLGQRQQVEILKALYRQSEILILDEPTSVLTPLEVERLFGVLRRLADEGVGIVIITHKLHEVLAVGDRITVLRRGRVVGRTTPSATSESELRRWMFGERGVGVPRDAVAGRGGAELEVRELVVAGDDGRSAVNGVSLRLESGEIFGLAGVSGNGQLELAEAIAGVRAAASGRILLSGESLGRLDPSERRKRGLVYIPEEHDAALVADLPMQDNLVLADYRDRPYSQLGLLRRRLLRRLALTLSERFRLPSDRLASPVKRLSGGNQQRVVLARSLAGSPSVLVAVQATQGLDLATMQYVHELVRSLRDEGGAVLFVSTDIDELLGLADRIGVMSDGRIAGVLQRQQFSRTQIGYLMTAGSGP